MPTTNDLYPNETSLRTGDVLFPRRPDVKAFPNPWTEDLWARDVVDGLADAYDLSEPQRKQLAEELNAFAAPQDVGPEEGLLDKLTLAGRSQLGDFALLCSAMVWSQGDAVVKERRQFPVVERFLDLSEKLFHTRPDQAIFLNIYVGHVAIVDRRTDGRLWIVESTYAVNGVRMQPYDEWVAHRRELGAYVWHGRLIKDDQEIDPVQAQRVVDHAHLLRMLCKPYDIFDRATLDDDTYVYCSELVWRCAKQIGLDLDTRSVIGKLLPFLGPRALTLSPHMRMLNVPKGMPY